MISPEDILRAKILLVDDCEDNLFAISESLRLAGYTEVSMISNPMRVRELHETNNYDLIVLDMQMPHMDGLEVMESLLGVEKTPYLPVLTITGNSDYKIAALKAGARDFLTKPYDLTELHQRIHNLLEVRLLYKNMSEQNRVQQELALRDPLTNLPNRRLLLDRIEKSIQRASREDQSVALFFLDLDGFKEVNDQHGHAVGDMLLKTVGHRLENMTREHDTVARMGGDEFVMLISGIADPADAIRPASDALTILSQPYKINDLEVRVTASIGIAFYPAHGNDAESLLEHADKSLYDAKRSGKNRFHLAKMIEQSSAAKNAAPMKKAWSSSRGPCRPAVCKPCAATTRALSAPTGAISNANCIPPSTGASAMRMAITSSSAAPTMSSMSPATGLARAKSRKAFPAIAMFPKSPWSASKTRSRGRQPSPS